MNYAVAFSRQAYGSKLDYGSSEWQGFNGSFINLDLDTNSIMSFIYRGHAITTQHAHQWRATKNYLRGQHIGLDFDNEDDSCRLPVLARDKFVQRYASFVHTTISHTPDKPRARVMFLLDAPIMQAKNYSLAAAALLWVFGTADRQCKDAVRFFYGSPRCEFERIGQVLPLAVVKTLIAKYQESGAMERKRSTRRNYQAPASQREVSDALKSIDPLRIDYDDWLAVLMAIHAEFGESGLALADSWAAGKPGEVARKWRSFDHNGNEKGAVTIATVFGLAKEHGWQRGTEN